MQKTTTVGISSGDTNGIGLEVVLKTLRDKRILDYMIPIIYASSPVVDFHKNALELDQLILQKFPSDGKVKKGNIYVKECFEEDIKVSLGEKNATGGKAAVWYLKSVTNDLAAGVIDAIVTAPINKENVQGGAFNFPGHTEFLAKLSQVDRALMLMVSENLKVAIVTGHIPLKDVSSNLSLENIKWCIETLNTSLTKDFGIVKPKIAVLGLNPHAGEKGLLGDEEGKIILPAVEKAKQKGLLVFGPYPADGFFGNGSFAEFDGVLAMYHDQGLVPFKALSFGRGVNYTAGLPIVRTSPDHGTAFALAGKNKANPDSFRAALFTTVEVFKKRAEAKEMAEMAM